MSGFGNSTITRAIVPVFLLFAVGFPIVVASCPMESGDGSACTGCNPVSSAYPGSSGAGTAAGGNLRIDPSSACCETVITGIRVESHYIKTESAVVTISLPLELSGPVLPVCTPVALHSTGAPTTEGRVLDDLTLLTSSLLI